jgi:hypothetical protein
LSLPGEAPERQNPSREVSPTISDSTNELATGKLSARSTSNVTEAGLPQKQERVGRTGRALHAIRCFVDRHLTTRTIIAATILVLLTSWIYPPWILGSYRNVSHGWFFVFDTTRETAMRVDFGRLLLLDAIIVTVGGILAWAVFPIPLLAA